MDLAFEKPFRPVRVAKQGLVVSGNNSVISWRSDLLVMETGGPGENHRSVASH
jgi:hypothetical protein